MTAIHQIELTQPLAAIDTGAERCMLILRWRGRVVGRTVTPVVERAPVRDCTADGDRAQRAIRRAEPLAAR
jgi:hypothetical protein